MTGTFPKVSVIMPCFNHARFVLDSARSILRQTHEDLELIITDDCSSDNSWLLVCELAREDSRVRPIRHQFNQGASRSRNDGMEAATGEFFAFCDADDVWEADKLKEQLSLLERHPEADVAYCDSVIIDENGKPTGQRFSELHPPPKNLSGALFSELLVRNFINMQSVLMRRACTQRAGHFDERIKWVEDWWYWLCVSRHHRFVYSKQTLARYRVHSGSTNQRQKRGYCINRFKVFRRILRTSAHLPGSAKASVCFQMGAELCNLGKHRTARRVLWDSLKLSTGDPRALPTFAKALRRLALCSGWHRKSTVDVAPV